MKQFRWAKSAAALIALFLILFLWGRSSEAAEVGIGLGAGVNHSSGAVGQELSVTSDDLRWFASYTRLGGRPGDTVLAYNNRWVGAYRVFWRRDHDLMPYMALGAAYFEEPTVLVTERLTYDLRVGLRWNNIVELEYAHNSTAGRSQRNAGIDFITLRAVFRF